MEVPIAGIFHLGLGLGASKFPHVRQTHPGWTSDRLGSASLSNMVHRQIRQHLRGMGRQDRPVHYFRAGDRILRRDLGHALGSDPAAALDGGQLSQDLNRDSVSEWMMWWLMPPSLKGENHLATFSYS